MSYELPEQSKHFIAQIIKRVPCTLYSESYSQYLEAICKEFLTDIRMNPPICLHMMYFWIYYNKGIKMMDMEMLASGAVTQ